MSEWQGFSDRELEALRQGVREGDRRSKTRGRRAGAGLNGSSPAPNSTVTRNGGHVRRPPTFTAPARKLVTTRGGGGGRQYASGPSPSSDIPASGDLSRAAFFHAPDSVCPQSHSNGQANVTGQCQTPVGLGEAGSQQMPSSLNQSCNGPESVQKSQSSHALRSGSGEAPLDSGTAQLSTENSETDPFLTDRYFFIVMQSSRTHR